MKRHHPSLWLNQYGEKFRATTIKELRVSKMYRDTKEGKVIHTGYVIGRHWLSEYQPVIREA